MSPRGVCTHVRRVPPGRELGRPGGGGVGGSGLFCSFWIPVEQLRRRASPPDCPGLPTAPRRAPHAAVLERLHRGRAQAHTWVELCGRPSQTYQDGPGKRFQRAGTHAPGGFGARTAKACFGPRPWPLVSLVAMTSLHQVGTPARSCPWSFCGRPKGACMETR